MRQISIMDVKDVIFLLLTRTNSQFLDFCQGFFWCNYVAKNCSYTQGECAKTMSLFYRENLGFSLFKNFFPT